MTNTNNATRYSFTATVNGSVYPLSLIVGNRHGTWTLEGSDQMKRDLTEDQFCDFLIDMWAEVRRAT